NSKPQRVLRLARAGGDGQQDHRDRARNLFVHATTLSRISATRLWRDASSGLRPALVRAPITLEIGDQSRTEMAIGLLARVDRKVGAESIERLLGDAQRPPVPRRAYAARAGESRNNPLDRFIHGAGRHDLITDEPPLRAVAFEPPLIKNRLA